jgi:hypothetical protein
MYRFYFFLILVVALDCSLCAQHKDSLNSRWAFTTTGYYYFIPEENNVFTLISYADHKKLHLEARYNYEDEKTLSLFAGWRFQTNGKVQFGATPMVGLAVGNTKGLVPGIELEMRYWKLDYYSETEAVVDFSAKQYEFFYLWGELGFNPIESFRTGAVIQKTKLYQSEIEIQKGIFAQYNFSKLTAGTYYFNPFSNNNFLILSISINF